MDSCCCGTLTDAWIWNAVAKIGHDDDDGRSGTDDEYDDKSEDIVITTTSDNNRRDDWCCRGFFARRRTIADLRDEKTATYYTVDATSWREGPQWPVASDGEKEGKEKGGTMGRRARRLWTPSKCRTVDGETTFGR